MESAAPRLIETNIAVQGGAPVIAGTRVPVAVLVESVASGDSIADTATNYRVTEEQVRAALMYAAGLVKSEHTIAISA